MTTTTKTKKPRRRKPPEELRTWHPGLSLSEKLRIAVEEHQRRKIEAGVYIELSRWVEAAFWEKLAREQ